MIQPDRRTSERYKVVSKAAKSSIFRVTACQERNKKKHEEQRETAFLYLVIVLKEAKDSAIYKDKDTKDHKKVDLGFATFHSIKEQNPEHEIYI